MTTTTQHHRRTNELFPASCLRTSGLLLEAHLAMSAAFETHAVAPLGIERDLADLLVRLTRADGNGLRGVDIGTQLFMNPARVSRLVDRAEKAGLVERLPDPRDRRAQLVTLTRGGKQKAKEFSPLMLDVINRTIFSELSDKELATLETLLDRVRKVATTVAKETSP